MSDYCDSDTGFDYVFARLSAIYGASFARHWDGIDPQMIRQEWKNQLGIYLTYRPRMDYAINHCDPNYPPSALKFKELCSNGPSSALPTAIENRPSVKPMPPEIRAQLAELRKKLTHV
jgi:hypothetical protein